MSGYRETWTGEDAEDGREASTLDAPGYEVLGLLGRGGMGEVWSVRDPLLGRELALKVIRPELAGRPGLLRRFGDEARATAVLEHPGVPPVHALGQLPDGRPYYTMKVLRGETLDARAARLRDADGDHAVERIVSLVVEAARAVGYAHARGLVHRDLKPQNILVGDHGEVTVVDWGLVKRGGDTDLPPEDAGWSPAGGTRAGAVVGTPGFMAPEQAAGLRVGPAADVYALAATLLAVAGPPDALPAGLAEVCRRALAADPAARPPDAGALADDLAAWRDGDRQRARQGALVRGADDAWAALSQEARPLAHEALLRCLDAEGRPVAALRALVDEVATRPVVEALLAGGVLRAEGDGVALADPSLAEEWPRLRALREAEAGGLALRARLAVDVARASAGRTAHWDAAAVQEADARLRARLSVAERRFLDASRRAVARGRRLRLAAAAGFLAFATMAAVALGLSWRRAVAAGAAEQDARRVAEGRALLLRGEQAEFHHRPHEALALYRAASAVAPELGSGAADRVASMGLRGWVLATHPGGAHVVEWSEDGAVVFSGGADGWIHAVRAADGVTVRKLGPLVYDVLDVAAVADRVAAWGYFDALATWAPGGDTPRLLPAGRRARAGLVRLPDGTVVTGGRDGLVRRWDLDAGSPVATWASPDGSRPYALAVAAGLVGVGSHAGEITTLSLPDLRPLHVGTLAAKPAGLGFLGEDLLAVERGGRWVRVGERVGEGRFGGLDDVTALAVGPATVAVASGTRVHLLDRETLTEARVLDGQGGRVDRLLWDASGSLLASASEDSTVVWTVVTGHAVDLQGHDAPVRRVAFQPRGAAVATAGLDGTSRVWELVVHAGDGTPLTGGPAVSDLVASGTHVVTRREGACAVGDDPPSPCDELVGANGPWGAWTRPGGEVVVAQAGQEPVVLPPVGAIVSGDVCGDTGRVVIVTREGAGSWAEAPDWRWHTTALEADPFLVWGDACRLQVGLVSALGSDGVWDLATGARLRQLPHPVRLNFLPAQTAASIEAGLVAVAGHAGGVRLYPWSTDGERFLDLGRARVGALRFAPDGARLAVAAFDRQLQVIDVATGDVAWAAGPYEGVLNELAFSSDGRHLAADSDAGVVRVWDAATGRLLRTFRAPRAGPRRLVFLPDGRLSLPLADGTWRAWGVPAEPPDAAGLTNLRVCRQGGAVVPVLPFPRDPSPWAPDEACPG